MFSLARTIAKGLLVVDCKDIGRRIRTIRMECGMTQALLADCSQQEMELISDVVLGLKASLRCLNVGSKS